MCLHMHMSIHMHVCGGRENPECHPPPLSALSFKAGSPTEPGAHWQARPVVTKPEVSTAEVRVFRIKVYLLLLKNIKQLLVLVHSCKLSKSDSNFSPKSHGTERPTRKSTFSQVTSRR